MCCSLVSLLCPLPRILKKPDNVGKVCMLHLWMENLQHVSKEYELVVLKYLELHLRASISTCFGALEPVWGRLGDHPGMGTLKT